MTSLLTQARADFHAGLVADHTLSMTGGVASNADGGQNTSIAIAAYIAEKLGAQEVPKKLPGQRAGTQFEVAVEAFLGATYPKMQSLRPGDWNIENVGGSRAEYQIAKYEPFTHLDDLANAIEKDPMLSAVLGNSYQISPDVIVTRNPEPDEVINKDLPLVDGDTGLRAIIRKPNQDRRIIHAVVSCKWTLRSDRAQNARSEALGIIRNRKGRAPHIVVVTAEPTPSRLASLALGTGDMDMVYHFALPELIEAVQFSGNDEAESMLGILLDGKRLRDIADLPLDLAV